MQSFPIHLGIVCLQQRFTRGTFHSSQYRIWRVPERQNAIANWIFCRRPTTFPASRGGAPFSAVCSTDINDEKTAVVWAPFAARAPSAFRRSCRLSKSIELVPSLSEPRNWAQTAFHRWHRWLYSAADLGRRHGAVGKLSPIQFLPTPGEIEPNWNGSLCNWFWT